MFKVGDRVRVIRNPPPEGVLVGWVQGMNATCGRCGVVKEVIARPADEAVCGVLVDDERYSWCYLESWLTLLGGPK